MIMMKRNRIVCICVREFGSVALSGETLYNKAVYELKSYQHDSEWRQV